MNTLLLRDCRNIAREIKGIQHSVEMLSKFTINYRQDGMPKAKNNKRDITGEQATTLADSIMTLQKKAEHLSVIIEKVEKGIKKINNPTEREFLRWRFYDGLEMWEIAEKMNYTESHLYNIQRKALSSFARIKDVD